MVAQQAPPKPGGQAGAEIRQDAPKKPASSPGKPANKAAERKSDSKEPGPPDAEAELQRTIEEAGNDRAALVAGLEKYLQKLPETPFKVEVYRAIVESSMQLRDSQRALEYAERIVALRPDDSAMMLFAVDLLERAGDDASLRRAVAYTTRVIDRVEKAGAEGKPLRASQADWEAQQKWLAMSVYLVRGRLEMERRNYDAAVADLETSYRLTANPAAALRLGEIYELRKDYDRALEQYLVAFMLPDQFGVSVNRAEVRKKLGNLWTTVHGSEAGLGARLLDAYDRLRDKGDREETARRNVDAKSPHEFVLRRAAAEAPLALSEAKGKVLVMNFWATWCLPCRELEPLFEEVERQYEGQPDVVFLAVNTDEDEAVVPPYLEREKLRSVVVFADGLDEFLRISSIPTTMVLDREGKIVYRAQGFAPDGFVEALSAAIEKAKSSK